MSVIGKIESKKRKRMFEDTYVEWKITDFFSVTEYTYSTSRCYESSPFYFGGVLFVMELYPRNCNHPSDASLYLKSNTMSREFTVEYSFALKKYNNYVESLGSGVLNRGEKCCLKPVDLNVSRYEDLQHVVVSDKAVTIICMLNAKMSLGADEWDNTKGLKLRKLDKLSENLKDLFSNKDSCDVTLQVQDKEFKAHKFILIARCSVFAANFKHDTLESRTGIIKITDCDSDSIAKLLEYLYSGQLEGLSYEGALNLYHAADKYGVDELKAFCVDYLKECLTVENMHEIFLFGEKYSETALFSAVQDFFNKNVDQILVTPEWETLMKTQYHLANKLLIKMPKVKCDVVPQSIVKTKKEPSTSPSPMPPYHHPPAYSDSDD